MKTGFRKIQKSSKKVFSKVRTIFLSQIEKIETRKTQTSKKYFHEWKVKNNNFSNLKKKSFTWLGSLTSGIYQKAKFEYNLTNPSQLLLILERYEIARDAFRKMKLKDKIFFSALLKIQIFTKKLIKRRQCRKLFEEKFKKYLKGKEDLMISSFRKFILALKLKHIVKRIKKVQIFFKFRRLRKQLKESEINSKLWIQGMLLKSEDKTIKFYTTLSKYWSNVVITAVSDKLKENELLEKSDDSITKKRELKAQMWTFNIFKEISIKLQKEDKLSTPNEIDSNKSKKIIFAGQILKLLLFEYVKKTFNEIKEWATAKKLSLNFLNSVTSKFLFRILKIQGRFRILKQKLAKRRKIKEVYLKYLEKEISTAVIFMRWKRYSNRVADFVIRIQRYFKFKLNYVKNKILLTSIYQIGKLFMIKKGSEISLQDLADFKMAENNVNVLTVIARIMEKWNWGSFFEKIKKKFEKFNSFKYLMKKLLRKCLLRDLKQTLQSKN
jgi:hypothetical protein